MTPENIHVFEQLSQLQSTLTATQLYHLFMGLEGVVRDSEYPRLVIGRARNADDQLVRTLACPHCDTVVTDDEGGEYTTLTAQDIAYRNTSMTIDPDGEPTVTAYYDGHGDYEGLVYLCETCAQPVSLPEGWTETS